MMEVPLEMSHKFYFGRLKEDKVSNNAIRFFLFLIFFHVVYANESEDNLTKSVITSEINSSSVIILLGASFQ